jgi:hypothetical protein
VVGALVNHTEASEIKAPLGEVRRATPTGEGADWQHAMATVLPNPEWPVILVVKVQIIGQKPLN